MEGSSSHEISSDKKYSMHDERVLWKANNIFKYLVVYVILVPQWFLKSDSKKRQPAKMRHNICSLSFFGISVLKLFAFTALLLP